ncbi:tyrosine-type recombinase/integrase [Priestia sp. TSO9]|uniref:tyrosine-type recombinase/integrase n=1 Tax=Priestia sp. TSO9 TaxID=2885632 RepID=UPI001E5B305C|nr:tyrosine-type recombinase/integrase [Priestia sp. TSO9]
MKCEPIKDEKIVKQFIEVLGTKRNGFVYSLYFEFALSTGLRVSDILELKKKDVKNGIVRVKTQKTGDDKRIALNDACRRKLEVYLDTKKDNDKIFDFNRFYVHRLLKWAADQIGYNKDIVSTHTTRKTAGWFVYLDSGKDLAQTQEFLGHRNPKDTMVYLMIKEDEVNQTLLKRSWS